MAKPRILHAGFEMWTVRISRSLPSIALILAVPFDGSRSRTFLCAPATAGHTIRMVPALRVLRPADYSRTTTRLTMENFSSKLAKCRPPEVRSRAGAVRGRHARDRESLGVA